MERFFAKIRDHQVCLSPMDEHHLVNVMRAKAGTMIEIVDAGDLYLAEVVSLSPLRIEIRQELSRPTELNAHLILGFSLLKGGHDELVLMKGTELGAFAFVPFLSERSIIRLDSKEREKRLQRFQKIVEGAANQSKRMSIPKITPILDYPSVLSYPADHRYLAYENLSGDVFNLPNELSNIKAGESALFLIGPEGGFSPKEAALAEDAGFSFVSLGKRILRAETASIFVASSFAFAEENK